MAEKCPEHLDDEGRELWEMCAWIIEGGTCNPSASMQMQALAIRRELRLESLVAKAREEVARDMRERIIKAMNVFAEQKSIDGKAMAALLEGLFSTLPLTEEE